MSSKDSKKNKQEKKTKSSGKSAKEKGNSMRSKSRSKSPPVRGKNKTPDDWAEAVPDGRACGICSEKDTSDDPCIMNRKRKWGYEPKLKETKTPTGTTQTYVNQGRTCYYCTRPYQTHYYPKVKIKEMPAYIGASQERSNEFYTLQEVCQEEVKKNQSYARIQWPSAEQLKRKMTDRVIWEEPDEIYMPEDDYTVEYGIPETNGLGHKRDLDSKGRKCVVVPDGKGMRKKKQRIYDATRESEIADGAARDRRFVYCCMHI